MTTIIAALVLLTTGIFWAGFELGYRGAKSGWLDRPAFKGKPIKDK